MSKEKQKKELRNQRRFVKSYLSDSGNQDAQFVIKQ